MRKGLLGGVLASVALMAGTAHGTDLTPIGADSFGGSSSATPATVPSRAPYHTGKGVPRMAYTGGRGPIKRNKSKRWHAKRLAKKVRR